MILKACSKCEGRYAGNGDIDPDTPMNSMKMLLKYKMDALDYQDMFTSLVIANDLHLNTVFSAFSAGNTI